MATEPSLLTAPAVPAPLLEVEDLCVTLGAGPSAIAIVDGVSLDIRRGQSVALVGESGCGKSTVALALMRLLPDPPLRIRGRTIRLHGSDARAEPSLDLMTLDERRFRRVRGRRMAMIFQEPATSLHPVLPIATQLVETIRAHESVSTRTARRRALALLQCVGVGPAERRAAQYPHELSGGMRQRVMIAIALAGGPELLIADEPTSALDVTVQAQILDLLETLRRDTGMAILLITHDFGVLARLAEHVYVMYAGRVVEHGPTQRIMRQPLHPYTRRLLECVPRIPEHRERIDTIPGVVPQPGAWPTGCRFHPRCALAGERASVHGGEIVVMDEGGASRAVPRRCVEGTADAPLRPPALRPVAPEHEVACWECEV
jgi:oligopeptide/dipeptide ABC transporter ATP-binding protein